MTELHEFDGVILMIKKMAPILFNADNFPIQDVKIYSQIYFFVYSRMQKSFDSKNIVYNSQKNY